MVFSMPLFSLSRLSSEISSRSNTGTSIAVTLTHFSNSPYFFRLCFKGFIDLVNVVITEKFPETRLAT